MPMVPEALPGCASPAAEVQPGHFYAIGVGPGEPDLLTLRGAPLLTGMDVILAPQSQRSQCSLALQAIAPLLAQQKVWRHQYPMEADGAKVQQRWQQLAQKVAQRCDAGQALAQITLGAPLIYASSYLLTALSVIKDSGQAGGTLEKWQAARKEGCRLLVVQRPQPEPEDSVHSLEQVQAKVATLLAGKDF